MSYFAMPNTIKAADLDGGTAARLFADMNLGLVGYLTIHGNYPYGILITDVDPANLAYPEGWYFAKGSFRNKHNSSSGIYAEVPMQKSDGSPW